MKNEKNLKEMKTRIWKKENVKKCLRFTCLIAVLLLCVTNPVYAAEENTANITSSMQNLQNLIGSFVSSVGSIVVLWGLFEWGNSMQGNDGMMQSAAFKRIGGGLVMTLGPQILSLLV